MAEDKAKVEPLKTDEHIGWLPMDVKEDKTLQLLIQEFLIKTPALETSFRSKGFVERFHLHGVADALTLYEYLTKDLEFVWERDSAGTLAEKIKEKGWDADDFWDKGELMAVLIPSATKKDVGMIVDGLPKATALVEERREVTKKYFNIDDAIFKHIRNSLAHGLFGVFDDSQGMRIYAFQDSNSNNDVSARIVLSEKRLRDWVTSFRRFEMKGV